MAYREEDDAELDKARSQNAPAERQADLAAVIAAVPGDDEDADEDDVEEHRRDRGREISMKGVEHPRHHRAERHADEVGEHDGRQFDGQQQLVGIVREARRDRVPDDEGHRQFHGDGQQQQHAEQDAEDLFGEFLGAGDAVRLDLLGEERHEGGVEGTLREQPPERIGELECRIEGFRHRPGAERGGHHHFAGEAEYAAQHRARADGGELLHEAHAEGVLSAVKAIRPLLLKPACRCVRRSGLPGRR